MCCRQILLVAIVLIALYAATEARYLPTRSQDDRLDRLRELLMDLLESANEKSSVNNYERRMVYKREVPVMVNEQAPLLPSQQ